MTVSTDLVVPYSGELVNLDDPKAVASTLADIRELEAKLRFLKGDLTRALLDEGERQGTKTLHLEGGVDVTITSSPEVTWDMEVLEQLRDAGLPEERWDALVTATVSYKVSAREAAKIARSGKPEYAVIIDRARTEHEAVGRVSVKR